MNMVLLMICGTVEFEYLILQMCANAELSKKTIYPTFARTYPMTKFVVPTLKALLNLFNWTTVALIYPADSGPYKETKDTVLRELKQYISHKYEIPTNTFQPKNHEKRLKDIVAEVKKVSRSNYCSCFYILLRIYI